MASGAVYNLAGDSESEAFRLLFPLPPLCLHAIMVFGQSHFVLFVLLGEPMKPQVIFGISIPITVIAMLIGWHHDPLFNRMPTPGMTIYFAVFGFVIASLLIFPQTRSLPLPKAGRQEVRKSWRRLLFQL
jgi:hypothetical protein